MKLIKFTLLSAATLMGVSFMSGCAPKAFEREINVVFMNEGKIVSFDTITQFKNVKSPSIDSTYVPSGYRFLGWTTYDENELDFSSATNFKSQYIGEGRMVHYSDVIDFVEGSTVVYNALILEKDLIPKDYHYVVMAWYNKPATSGLSVEKINTYSIMLNDYLKKSGVSDDDLNSIVIRPYTGNVGPSTGQIIYDDDVDIMFGWSGVDNITTTGSIPLESILESVSFEVNYNGTIKNRYIHRLTKSEGAMKLMEHLQTEEVKNFFKA